MFFFVIPHFQILNTMELNKNLNKDENRPYLKVDKIHWEKIPVKKPYSKRVAFFDLLDLCSYPPRTTKVRGIIVALEQNQGCPSLTFLEQRWGWKDVRKVSRFLNWLAEREIILLQKHPVAKCNLIKVVMPNTPIDATKNAPSTITDNQRVTTTIATISEPTIATKNASNTINNNSSYREEKNIENFDKKSDNNTDDTKNQVKRIEIFEKRKTEFLDYLNSEAGQLAWNTFLNGDEQLRKKQFTQEEMREQIHSMLMNFLNSEHEAMNARLHHENHRKIEYLRQWLLKDFRKSNKEKAKIEAQNNNSGHSKSDYQNFPKFKKGRNQSPPGYYNSNLINPSAVALPIGKGVELPISQAERYKMINELPMTYDDKSFKFLQAIANERGKRAMWEREGDKTRKQIYEGYMKIANENSPLFNPQTRHKYFFISENFLNTIVSM